MSQYNNGDHDDNLEQLYHHGATETTPEQLNQKILQASKQVINSEENNISFLLILLQHLLSSRGLAFTAVMVIGISVILQIQFEQPNEIMPEVLTELSQPDPVAAPSAELFEQAAESISSVEDKVVAKPAAPAKRKAPAKLEAEKQRVQRLAEEKRSQQALMKKQKAQSAQRKMLSQAPATAIAPAHSLISPLQLNTDRSCSERTQAACLASANCTLVETADRLICREPGNSCEKGFIQATQLAQQCTTKPGCELIPGDCQCDENENCQCKNMQPPRCLPVDSDDEDD